MGVNIYINCFALQSLHPMAEYHGAARAVGGYAIYVRCRHWSEFVFLEHYKYFCSIDMISICYAVINLGTMT